MIDRLSIAKTTYRIQGNIISDEIANEKLILYHIDDRSYNKEEKPKNRIKYKVKDVISRKSYLRKEYCVKVANIYNQSCKRRCVSRKKQSN